jgi:hypothetical protein
MPSGDVPHDQQTSNEPSTSFRQLGQRHMVLGSSCCSAHSSENNSTQIIGVESACLDDVLHSAKQGLTVPYAPVFIDHENNQLRIREEGEEAITGRMKPISIRYR